MYVRQIVCFHAEHISECKISQNIALDPSKSEPCLNCPTK